VSHHGSSELTREAESAEEDPDPTALADRWFLGTDAGNETYASAVADARDAVLATAGDAENPYSGATYTELRDRLDDESFPDEGEPLSAVIETARETILRDSVYPTDEQCVAHLQCPPTTPALAAEMLLTAVNQSMDSFDQAPAATVLEEQLIDDLADWFDLGPTADGVVTSGGTQSNLQGLLLARNAYVADTFGETARESGLPPEASGDARILCSADAHFTAEQSAAMLGLGEDAVVSIPTDDRHRMDPDALRTELDTLVAAGRHPVAVVGTAGTTDFGSVDPLAEIADVAEAHDVWLHVDAAFGGALALSETHADRLDGIGRADSVAVDFHKLCFQPVSCGAFLLQDRSKFDLAARNAAYLNPEGDTVPNLVGKSLQTSRRFDALKPWVTFQTLGKRGVGALVDRTIELAEETAAVVTADPAFDLAAEPAINTVVFRYEPSLTHPDLSDSEWADRVNRQIRDDALDAGQAVVARTEVDGRAHLKFTLMNPRTTTDELEELLLRLKTYGAGVEANLAESVTPDGEIPTEESGHSREVER
jgi:L-2,4-diaminobutyrate decarboxylase